MYCLNEKKKKITQICEYLILFLGVCVGGGGGGKVQIMFIQIGSNDKYTSRWKVLIQ